VLDAADPLGDWPFEYLRESVVTSIAFPLVSATAFVASAIGLIINGSMSCPHLQDTVWPDA
jgi:hypothetical protein